MNQMLTKYLELKNKNNFSFIFIPPAQKFKNNLPNQILIYNTYNLI